MTLPVVRFSLTWIKREMIFTIRQVRLPLLRACLPPAQLSEEKYPKLRGVVFELPTVAKLVGDGLRDPNDSTYS